MPKNVDFLMSRTSNFLHSLKCFIHFYKRFMKYLACLKILLFKPKNNKIMTAIIRQIQNKLTNSRFQITPNHLQLLQITLSL